MTAPGVLAGRRVVVTGAGRGLGRAFSIVAADEGAHLVLMGRDPTKLEAVASVIAARTGDAAEMVRCDLADTESVGRACRTTLDRNSTVDLLVNNGAPWLSGALADLSEAAIVATVTAAGAGTLLVTKGLLPGLRKSAAADIVNIVSTSGLRGREPGVASVAFTAAKFAQAGISDHLAAELRPQGIRVTAIYPPDFDNTDPLQPEWQADRSPASGARLGNREVVAAILFAATAPRVCAYTEIVLANMGQP